MTNATKANVIAAINALVALTVAFDVLSDAKAGALGVALNSLAVLFIGLTYKNSPKRVPDA